MGKLINRLPGSASLAMSTSVLKALPGKLSKDTHLVFSISPQASQCQQAFSKPCLVNLISKDTHLVFSLSRQASRCQQAFSMPCLVNLISKDTHLVFSMYQVTNPQTFLKLSLWFSNWALIDRRMGLWGFLLGYIKIKLVSYMVKLENLKFGPAGKGLTSWLPFVVSEFVTFSLVFWVRCGT